MSFYRERGKRALDIILGGVALLLSAPVMLVAAATILLWDRQHPLFSQYRLGRNGRRFRLYKLRTMRSESGGPTLAAAGDPRVTEFGKCLRKTSIDELPQLLNVLRGDMTLVGPRPELPQNLGLYPEKFMDRLAVRPGLTGLAQVSGRNELTFAEVLRLDLRYIDGVSLRTDLSILLCTIRAVFHGRGAY
jgi:lipopolysaccharide/colanic/teichoic acid biosynthesis glycosyltransferase